MSDYDSHDSYDSNGAAATPATAAEDDSWRHPVNVGHLVMGIAFLGMVLVWALVVGGAVPRGDIRWLMPIPWVAAGGAGLVAIALSARRRS